jgi:tetratricopeptide (TPR) repeat protein
LHPRSLTIVVLAALLVAGCAGDPFRGLANAARTPVELDSTPFFPQERYQCGPAALATILNYAGVDVPADELVPRVYIPERRGSLQPELLAASREYGRIPYVIAPEFSALLAEIDNGRPILVLQNLGIQLAPAWHYAVVVGYAPQQSDIILRSGIERRRVTSAGVFARTWKRSDNWGMVALRPGELPANPDKERYLKAVAAAESAGRFDLAAPSYAAAAARWPESKLAWFGRGNSAYAQGDARQAERWYRRALQIDPHDRATLNNLATVVALQGRCSEATELIETAIALPAPDESIAALLAASKAEIAACRSPARQR